MVKSSNFQPQIIFPIPCNYSDYTKIRKDALKPCTECIYLSLKGFTLESISIYAFIYQGTQSI